MGFELYNFLREVPFELIVHNIGCVFSMGNPIFLAADTRFASPQSTFKFHDFHWNPSNRNYSQADLRLMADEVNIHQGFADEILVERTSITPEQAKEFCRDQKILVAEQALELGIVQKVKDFELPSGANLIRVP